MSWSFTGRVSFLSLALLFSSFYNARNSHEYNTGSMLYKRGLWDVFCSLATALATMFRSEKSFHNRWHRLHGWQHCYYAVFMCLCIYSLLFFYFNYIFRARSRIDIFVLLITDWVEIRTWLITFKRNHRIGVYSSQLDPRKNWLNLFNLLCSVLKKTEMFSAISSN